MSGMTNDLMRARTGAARADRAASPREHRGGPPPVDAGGLIREFSMNEQWSVQAPPSGTTSVTLLVDVTGYGSPVPITAPPASDTYVNGELRVRGGRCQRRHRYASITTGMPA